MPTVAPRSSGPPEERLDALLDRLEARPGGLSSAEAAARLADHGPNELDARPRRTALAELGRSVAGPLALILLAAAVASAFLGEVADAVIIAAMVSLSAGINTWQTSRSARVVAGLQARVRPTEEALRDGDFRTVPRRELVVGDVIRLSAGDLVPADARLLESTDLHVQQAALTGEALPAEKRASDRAVSLASPDAPELVFAGVSVVSGSGTAVVFATGRATAFGAIVARLAARPEETEFDRSSRRFGGLILQTVVVLVFLVLVVGLSLGREPFQTLLFAVALAVGLTPEYLPMITTVTLAQGAARMARGKVVVRHLASIQNLGSMDVLCSDKTGTLTSGEMSLDAALDPLGKPSGRPLSLGRLNSRFETGVRSALDAAILAAGEGDAGGYEKLGELPFDFERRRVSVAVARGDERLLVTKGAPEGVLDHCDRLERDGVVAPFDDAARDEALALFRTLGTRGLRVLAVAYRPLAAGETLTRDRERGLVFAGYLTFADQLLEGVPRAIRRLRADGVAVKILSGDNELVTRTLCERAGLAVDRVVTGAEVERLDEPGLAWLVERAHVFARLSPNQKHRIVMTLKHHGHVVGYLGDGINDAPSLHGADVGISVAGAVDVAREASDLVLLERRLDVLHAGIAGGRRSFANVLKYLMMGTSSNFGNMLSMAGAVCFLPFLPMLPTQILVNNFLYDVAQITIPTDHVDPAFVRGPQRLDIRSLRRFMLLVGPLSSIFDFLTFAVLLRGFDFGSTPFQTGWFVESLSTQVLVLFVIRTAGRPWTNRPSRALAITALLVVALGLVLPLTPAAGPLGMVPLPGRFYAFLALVIPVYLALVELVKGRLLGRMLAESRVG
jgi:Mg2+-importing ATPase